MNGCLFYHRYGEPSTVDLVAPYRLAIWEPSGFASKPPATSALPFSVWSFFHHAKIFSNPSYRVLQIFHRDSLVHRCCVFPPYFRFPFMKADDLQLGDIWTSPEHRGQGLAKQSCKAAMALAPERRYWYLCKESNIASIRLADRLGFKLAGTGKRQSFFGFRSLGSYELVKAA